MRTPDIGHDAPWIEDAEQNGFGGTETPYDKASENDLLKAADEEFGWKVLALFLHIEPAKVPYEDTMQAVWLAMYPNARAVEIDTCKELHADELRDWYDEWYRYRTH